MASPRYTEEDMRTLAKVSNPGSIPAAFLPGMGYSPKMFKEFLESNGLKKDVHYLFEIPIGEVPPLIVQEPLEGYLKFRMIVRK
jgi:hypothetical protein